VDDLLIRLAAPVQPKMEVDWGNSTPDPRRHAALMLQPVNGPGLTMLTPEMESSPGITPGKYRIAAGVPVGDVYVASVSFGGMEVLGQVVDLEAGAPPLHVSYKKSTSSVRGTVAQGEGATVLFWSQRQADPDFTVMTSVRCGPNGNFEANTIAPGDYYAAAVVRVDSRSLSNPSVLQRLMSVAATVRVDEGATTVLQLPLTPTD